MRSAGFFADAAHDQDVVVLAERHARCSPRHPAPGRLLIAVLTMLTLAGVTTLAAARDIRVLFELATAGGRG
jgi:hypothetical protein